MKDILHSTLLFISLLLFQTSIAQVAEVIVGKPYQVTDARHKYYFAREDDVISVIIKGNTLRISTITNKTLELSNRFIYKIFPNGYNLESVNLLNDNLYVFYSLVNPTNQYEQLYALKINFNDLERISKETLVLENKKPLYVGHNFYSKEHKTKYSFYTSFDESKLLITYTLKPADMSMNSYYVIGLNVFDDQLKSISKSEIKMTQPIPKIDILDYSVDSDGNTYMVNLKYGVSRFNDNNEEEYFLELMKVKPNTNEFETIPVALKGKFINQLWLYEFDKNKMVCAGFYNNDKNGFNADGIILFNVEKNNAITNMTSYEIPLEILNQFESKRNRNKNVAKENKDKAEMKNLTLRQLFHQEDGSYILTGEQQLLYGEVYSKAKGGNLSSVSGRKYDDILACKINADGSLAWMRRLPKSQTSGENIGDISFNYKHDGQSHYFLFMDNINNLKLPFDEMPDVHENGNNGYLTAYKVNDATGNVEKISIASFRKLDLHQFHMHRIQDVSAKEFVFEAYKKGGEDVMIKVILK